MARMCFWLQDCDAGDYERWTPLSPQGDCLAGQRLSLERRKRDATCFNGKDHERSEATHTLCPCEAVSCPITSTHKPCSLPSSMECLIEHKDTPTVSPRSAQHACQGVCARTELGKAGQHSCRCRHAVGEMPGVTLRIVGVQVDMECEFGFEPTTQGCIAMAGIGADQCGEISGKGYLTSSTKHRLVHGDVCTDVQRIIPDTNGHGGLPGTGGGGAGGSSRGHGWLITIIVFLVSGCDLPNSQAADASSAT